MLPGGLKSNREFLADCVGFASDIAEENRALLYDPQTSGGLLIAISPQAADAALGTLQQHGVSASRIGRVLPKTSPLLPII
jgi:selenide,water dikinase